MGALILPASGLVYVDTQAVIYAVERHPDYAAALQPLWMTAQAGTIQLISSDLALMETLVVPIRNGDMILQADFERFLLHMLMQLQPITQAVLREAARLRAALPGLKTPDAIHAATATVNGCALFVTNDAGFRRVPGLPLAVLDEVRAAP